MTGSLAKKLCDAARRCRHVERDGVNAEHRYRYMSADQVAAEVGSALLDAGVVALSRYELITPYDATHETQRSGAWRYARVSCVITLIDADSGETLEVQGYGDGVDPADKAILKAQTASWRDAIKRLVFATSKDAADPEADERTDRDGALASASRASQSRTQPTTRQAQDARQSQDAHGPQDERQSTAAHRAVDDAPAPRRAAAPESLTFAYGPGKDAPIKDLDTGLLRWYAARCEESIADPTKARWRRRETALLNAVNEELARRAGGVSQDAEVDPFGGDDIPF